MNLVRLLRRIAITVVGTVILAVGVVLLVAPGPGLLVILLALIVFAVEYEWARRRLDRCRRCPGRPDRAGDHRIQPPGDAARRKGRSDRTWSARRSGWRSRPA